MYVKKDISSTAYILPLSFLEDMILPRFPATCRRRSNPRPHCVAPLIGRRRARCVHIGDNGPTINSTWEVPVTNPE